MNGEEVPFRKGRAAAPAALLRPGPNEVTVAWRGGPPVFASAILGAFEDAEVMGPEPGALKVERTFQVLKAKEKGKEGEESWRDLPSGGKVKVGDVLLVKVHVSADRESRRLCIESPIPAGTEACEDPGGEDWWDWSGRRELRDDRVTLALESLGSGDDLTYRLRAIAPGAYRALPAVAFEMYDPDRHGSSGEFVLVVEE